MRAWHVRVLEVEGGGEGGGSSNPEKGGSGRGEDVPVVGEEGCPHQLGHLPHRSPSEALCVTRQPPCKAPALWAGSQSAGSTPGARRIRPSARETSRTAGGKARKLPHICAARPHGVVRRVRGGGAPRGGTCGGRSPRGSPSCSDREQGVRMSGACRPLSPLDSSHRREDQETFPIVCPVISTDIANSLSLPPSPFTSLSLPPLSPPLPPPLFFLEDIHSPATLPHRHMHTLKRCEHHVATNMHTPARALRPVCAWSPPPPLFLRD